MADRRIRIYSGAEDANVLGFSSSADEAATDPRLTDFLKARGYATKILETDDEIPPQSVSGVHLEVRPPIALEHLQELGLLLLQIVNAGNNQTFVIDNRESPVTAPMGGGELIAMGM